MAALQEICCCMGQPVAGNPTQYMMEKAFAARRARLAVSDAGSLRPRAGRRRARDAGHGLSRRQLHDSAQGGGDSASRSQLSEAAALMGAVNCVDREGDNSSARTPTARASSSRCAAHRSGGQATWSSARRARPAAIAVELGLAGAAEITVVNRTRRAGRSWPSCSANASRAGAIVRWEGDYDGAAPRPKC